MNEEKTSIDEISAIIRWMLNQYKEIYCDFDEYRTTVKNLELNFTYALQRMLVVVIGHKILGRFAKYVAF